MIINCRVKNGSNVVGLPSRFREHSHDGFPILDSTYHWAITINLSLPFSHLHVFSPAPRSLSLYTSAFWAASAKQIQSRIPLRFGNGDQTQCSLCEKLSAGCNKSKKKERCFHLVWTNPTCFCSYGKGHDLPAFSLTVFYERRTTYLFSKEPQIGDRFIGYPGAHCSPPLSFLSLLLNANVAARTCRLQRTKRLQ